MLRCALPYLQHTQPPIIFGGNAGLDGVRALPAGGESVDHPWLQTKDRPGVYAPTA